jgi:O-antigen ligase
VAPAWILGLDQAVWLAVGLLIAIGARRPTSVLRFVAAGSVFLGVAIIAGLLSVSGVRTLSLARELLIFVAFAAAAMGTAGRRDAKSGGAIVALAIVLVLSALLSVAAFVTQERFEFETVVAPLVPPVIADTGLGHLSFVTRALADTSYFLGVAFMRPRGLFLFSTSQAVALATWVPIVLYLAVEARGWQRTAWTLGAVVMAAGLLTTTTRFPLLALAVALALVLIMRWLASGEIVLRIPFTGRHLVAYGLLAVIAAGLAAKTPIAGSALELVTTRSLEGRSALYEWTLDEWMKRPVLGWGTEVDPFPTPTPGPSPSPTPTPTPTAAPSASAGPQPTPIRPQDQPPLGSHSAYLGVLFKQGILGLAAFLLLISFVIVGIARSCRAGGSRLLLGAAAITSLAAGLTEAFWLDPATAVCIGACWGLVMRSPKEAEQDIP